jgi:hypothetical protein
MNVPGITNPIPTSQQIHFISITKTNRIIQIRNKIALYYANHTKHMFFIYIYTVGWVYAIFNVKVDGMYVQQPLCSN